MGSFSYSCRLSGLPITAGDAAVLIPLVARENVYDNELDHVRNFGTTHYCSNEGASVFFMPAAFPIFGTYNDYGGLKDIEHDDNTKSLEEFYDLSIEEIVEIICSGRKDDGYDDCLEVIKEKGEKPDWYREGEGHFEAYQRITKDKMPFGNGNYPDEKNGQYNVYKDGKKVKGSKKEYDENFKLIHEQFARYQKWTLDNPDDSRPDKNTKYKEKYLSLVKMSGTWMRRELYDELAKIKRKDSFDKIDLGVPAILNSLGFKETGKSKDSRYNRVFSKGNLSINSDGNWINIPGEQIYNVQALKKYCLANGEDIEIDGLVSKNMYEQIYDYILPDTKKNK